MLTLRRLAGTLGGLNRSLFGGGPQGPLALTLAVGGTAPHAVRDSLLERVFEAFGPNRTFRTNLAGGGDTGARGREEVDVGRGPT